MADAYQTLKDNRRIIEIFDKVNFRFNQTENFRKNTADKNYKRACNGRYHAMYVVGVVEYILHSLSYDRHTIELGKIAGLLHDIGYIYDGYNHARISAAMCSEFYDKTNLTIEDWQIIQHAILEHSNGNNISCAVEAALLIADKIDMSKHRTIAVKEDLKKSGLTDENELNKYDDDLCLLDAIDISISNKIITFNFITTINPLTFRAKRLNPTNRNIRIIEEACAYLKLKTNYEVNGTK